MKRPWKIECAAAIIVCSIGIPSAASLARGNQQQAAANNAAAMNAANAARAQEMQQAQARAAAGQQAQAQAQARQMQEAQMEARRSQEQALKTQEEGARRAQQEAMKAQQEQAKQMQEQAMQVQRQQQAAQEQARNAQMKAQMQAAQGQQRQAQRAAQEQMKAQQRQTELAQRQSEQAQKQAQEVARAQESGRSQEASRGQEAERAQEQNRLSMAHASGFPGTAAGARAGIPAMRPVQARPLSAEHVVPIEKAISMPVLEENIAPADKEHAQVVLQNLQKHLVAVPGNKAPSNFGANRSTWINNYTNNYWTTVNNQRLLINRNNTYVDQCLPNAYPYWYQPESGWQFANGFVLGNSLRVGLDWLRWGWHPYYGPSPDGFVCADDYVPTPWIYFPAYGLWQQPGVYGWAPSGPPYDYTGPITVEVLEPRHIQVRDPYTNWERKQVINVVYLYNAFFDEEYEHWGYMNRHGYFVWLDI